MSAQNSVTVEEKVIPGTLTVLHSTDENMKETAGNADYQGPLTNANNLSL